MPEEKETKINETSMIHAKPGVILREESDKWGLLYDPERDFSFGLNPVSVFIWEQIKTDTTIDEIVIRVKKQFDSVDDDVKTDVIEFIDSLVKNQLAVVRT